MPMGDPRGLADRLEKRGLLASGAAKGAFQAVDPGHFVLPRYRLLAYEDAPVPFHEGDSVGLVPSRRLAATLLQLVGAGREGSRILYGSEGGYLAALLRHLDPAHDLIIVEEEEELARTTARNLARAGL
ncbi:MAG: hypothetical protein ACE5EW_03865, partial [Thermoplasmata archaeon]